MMKNKRNHALKKINHIEKHTLPPNAYTLSLLQKALDGGLLDSHHHLTIQKGILDLLQETIMSYTKGESTSTTVDITQDLLCSIMYVLDFYAMEYANPIDALATFKTSTIKDIYSMGLKHLMACLEKTRGAYIKLYVNKLSVELEPYQLTLSQALPMFFEQYNLLFGAHYNMGTIDYPLAIPIDDIQIRGVSFIAQYLYQLKLETLFCRFFTISSIEDMLENYGQRLKYNYKIELINLFQLLFNNACFSILIGNSPLDLLLTPDQFNDLNAELKALDSDKLSRLVNMVFKKLLTTLDIQDIDLLDYLQRYFNNYFLQLNTALGHDQLINMVILAEEKAVNIHSHLFQGDVPMSNDDFTTMISKITTASNTIEIIEIIQSSICSLPDFMDLLSSGCLYKDDFSAIFHSLVPSELAILTHVVYYEKFRETPLNLKAMILEEIYVDEEWKENFVDYLRHLNLDQLLQVEQALDGINYVETDFY